MSDWKCPQCKQVLPSLQAMKQHSLTHESYLAQPASPMLIELQDIQAKTHKSLDTKKEQIKGIMLEHAETKSSNGAMWLRWLIKVGLFTYDSKEGTVNMKAKWNHVIKELDSIETCRRVRQLLQAEAETNIKAGIATKIDYDLLPSNRIAEQRRIQEASYKLYFVREKHG